MADAEYATGPAARPPAIRIGSPLAAATPVVTILEVAHGHNPLLREMVPEQFPLVEGCIEVNDRPGLGVTPDEAFVAEHRRVERP